MNWQGAFKVIIRVVFIFAYIAFLAASIRHVATFFHNFEADPTDWVNPYTLAVSIDLTALVLTVGVMFFRGNMPWYAQGFTWVFIVALTAFSWFVNWEYAMTFQGNDLKINDTLKLLNPILASSFAFLNLAYSVVAEFFSSKKKTAAELAAEIAELEDMEAHQIRLAEYKERTKKPSLIERAKNTALEARAAVSEVLTTEDKTADVGSSVVPQMEPQSEPITAKNVEVPVSVQEPHRETIPVTEVPQIEPEIETISEPTDELQSEPEFLDEFDDVVSLPVSTDEHESVSLAGSPRPRITGKLSETETKPERNTDKLKKPASKETKKLAGETEAKKNIRKMVKRNPAIEPVEIAKRARVTPQYAGRVKAQILSEMPA